MQLCGIIVGHLYFFLVFKYPQDFGGAQLLKTPSFLSVDRLIFACETMISHLVIVIFQMKRRGSVASVQLPFLVVNQVEPMILLPIVLVKPLVAVAMSWVINSDGLRFCLYSRLVMCSHLFVLTVKDAMRSFARCSPLTNENTKTLEDDLDCFSRNMTYINQRLLAAVHELDALRKTMPFVPISFRRRRISEKNVRNDKFTFISDERLLKTHLTTVKNSYSPVRMPDTLLRRTGR